MQRACRQCQTAFDIPAEDLAFYDKVSPVFNGKKEPLPPPTLCPQCRLRSRLLWRPELHLFKRKSDKSGKQILSYLPPEAPCTIYSPEEWWQDDWSGLEYGRAFDFSRPFADQFRDLLKVVPTVSLSIGGENTNSDYLNSASWLKNCYLIAGANYDEDCYYGNFVNHCKDCVDCSFVDHCELCYECIDCTQCYNLRYSQQCTNCSESAFLFACRGCRNCFGSVNLAEKQYVFLNEQLTKEEYEKKLAAAQIHLRSRVEEMRAFFDQHRLRYPHKYMIGEMNENATGNGILRSRNIHECFDVSDAEDCRYCGWFHKVTHCHDCYAWGFTAEECYYCTEVGADSQRVHFSVLTYGGSEVLYCFNCRANHHLFGCVSLRHQQYCILNKQYTKEEYETLVPKIIEHMRKTGEWGEYFPMSVSPFAYNQSIAQDYFPLSKEQAIALGARWGEESKTEETPSNFPIPDSIRTTDESICSRVLRCSQTGKPFKIVPQEFQFYKRNDIPVPTTSFAERHLQRLHRRNPRKLWARKCRKCAKDIQTSYAPDRPEIVYCEECYLKEVY